MICNVSPGLITAENASFVSSLSIYTQTGTDSELLTFIPVIVRVSPFREPRTVPPENNNVDAMRWFGSNCRSAMSFLLESASPASLANYGCSPSPPGTLGAAGLTNDKGTDSADSWLPHTGSFAIAVMRMVCEPTLTPEMSYLHTLSVPSAVTGIVTFAAASRNTPQFVARGSRGSLTTNGADRADVLISVR